MKGDYNASTADRSYMTASGMKKRRKSRKVDRSSREEVAKSSMPSDREMKLVQEAIKPAVDAAKMRAACDKIQKRIGDYSLDYFMNACNLIFAKVDGLKTCRAYHSPSRFWIVSCTIKKGFANSFIISARCETRKEALHEFYREIEPYLVK